MPKTPFFSILVPTKNRSHLVGFAIQSVLDQTFGDFEVIVSDNDDSDTLTRDVVAGFKDSRIKYYRTSGKLSMPDNWEFALSKSSGEYVTVLEDRQVFYPNTLKTLQDLIGKNYGPAITWFTDILDDTKHPFEFRQRFGSGAIKVEKPENVLLRFVSTGRFQFYAPRMINSCLSRKIIDFVQTQTPLKRFFIAVSPDICAGFIQLNYIEQIVHLEKSLTITGGHILSNGRSARIKGETAKRFIQEVGGIDTILEYSPLKVLLPTTVMLSDFIRLKQLLGGRIGQYEISNDVLLVSCYKDIISNQKLGANMDQEIKQWRIFFHSQKLDIPKKIRWRIYKLDIYKNLFKFGKLILGNNFINCFEDCIRGRRGKKVMGVNSGQVALNLVSGGPRGSSIISIFLKK